MLRRGIARASQTRCKNTAPGPRPVPTLSNTTVQAFQEYAFRPALPVLLPSHFDQLPAIKAWFSTDPGDGLVTINRDYLSRWRSTIVPLEITHKDTGHFARVEQPLEFFLEAASSNDQTPAHVYLAQASLSDLPKELTQDVPIPEKVLKAGKGDVYSSSIWIGRAPTYTPLHRDPNPNLFVQLAGRKVVRMYNPDAGLSVFDSVQQSIGGTAKATLRGEEMMEGMEREELEREVWQQNGASAGECWEATVGGGDGLFIPKGWWHSIKSIDEGIVGSVNWWFR